MTRQGFRVLILDDDREDVDLVRDLWREATGQEMDFVWASTYEEGLGLFRGEEVEVCLLDYRLGARTGIDFLREPEVASSEVPVILMTGRGTAQVDRSAMDAGAVDYLPKEGLTGEALERAVRYAAERRRRIRAEAEVRALIGNLQEMVSVLDPDGSFRYVSPAVLRILGFEPGEKTGEDAFLEVHPDDRPEVERAFRRVLQDPSGREELQYRVRHADGSWRTLDTIAVNHGDDLNIRGVLVSSRDITDRVQREEHVRFQATLLDAVGQAVIATDAAGKVIYWNPAAERLYGWSREEVTGRDIMELNVTPSDRETASQILDTVREEGTWTGEFQVSREDGSTFLALIALSPILDAQGALVGLVGVSSDITTFKETEAALRERVKELRTLSRASEILNLPDRSLEERLREVVELIPSGWLRPEHTEARLTLEDRSIQTRGFRETPWMQRVEIGTSDVQGRLDVALTAGVEEGQLGPFLPEEDELLQNLGRILGNAIRRATLQRLVTQAFRSLEEAVLLIDGANGGRGIRYVNPAAERMFGWPASELTGGDTVRLHVDEEAFRRFGEESRVALEKEGVYHGSFPLRRRDGSTFQAEQTVTLLDPELGHEGGAVSVIRDVSERKEADERLRESEERFRQIAEHIQDVFWITTPAKDVMEYVSPAYEAIWGRPRSELYTRPEAWLEAVAPADRDRVREAVARQAAGPYEEEFRIVRPNGEERWILDRSFPVHGPQGEVTRVIGVARDITEEKRAEERFGTLSQEISDAIYVLSEDGIVQTASPSVYQVTGYTAAEFEGMNTLEIVDPEDREAVRATLEEVAAEPDRSVRAECRIITKGGDVRQIESVARNLLGDPAVEGILVTSRDVSEREALERRVRQMQKMESVGRLAGGIAHDFNNILTVIRAQTDFLLMDLPPGPAAEEVGVIQTAAERAATLTRQLLAFSREQVLQPRTLDVAGVVQETGQLIERLIGENVQVDYRVSEGLPPVRLDPNQIEQVLLNLAVNARDAMPNGGTLTISVHEEELDEADAERLPGLEAGRYVVLAVSDTGGGMPEEVRERVFEPFFTTKERGKGTGLGLAMAYGTVKQSGGGIHVESEPGRGSTFYLRFPPVDGDVAEESFAAREPADSSDGGSATGRILVIDDDAAVRRVTAKVLEKGGFDVLEAGDAESGLELLEAEGRVDAVLSDLGLPGMSGLELVDRLQDLRPSLPVIVMSGYAEGSPGQAEGLPAEVAFVQKPFTPDRVIGLVREVLEGARPG